MLWLCLYLPDLPLDALRRGMDRDRPAAATEARGVRRWIVTANPAARALGVAPDMAVDAALALAPNLALQARQCDAERRALHGLAAWAGQFSDRVSLAPPAGLLIEAGASLRLFGGARSLTDRVRAEARALGYRARAALAPTPLAAGLLAALAHGRAIRQRVDLAKVLGAVPLAHLDMDPDIRTALGEAGARTLGDCLALPRAALARRFGPACLNYLDRLTGRADDPRLPFRPPARFDERLELPAEAEHTQALLFAARRLLRSLHGAASACDAGVCTLDLRLEHAEGPPTPVHVGLAAPARDPEHLAGLIATRLERLTLRAPVRALALASPRFVPLEDRQHDLLAERGRQPADRARLLETLAARLGERAVFTLATMPDHRPEQAWQAVPPARSSDIPRVSFGARPLWLLEAPRSIAPEDFQCLAGPERIESGWWDGADIRRDYFIVRTQGGARLWAFRAHGQWHVHGLFA